MVVIEMEHKRLNLSFYNFGNVCRAYNIGRYINERRRLLMMHSNVLLIENKTELETAFTSR